MMVPEVTIIVPTKNSEPTIELCIKSATAQSVPVELIVVDNYSSDLTVRLVQNLGANVVQAGPERSGQRNIGAACSETDWLLFIDSDMVLDPQVAASCLEVCREELAQAAIVPELAWGDGFLAACRALEKRCYLMDADIEAARFFERVQFQRLGGYDDSLNGPEDWDLPARLQRAGGRIARAQAPVIHLEGRIKLRATFAKKRYYGRTIARYRRLHPELASRQMRMVRPAFVRHWKELVHRPCLASGLLLLKLVEFAGIGAGMIDVKRSNTHPKRSNSHA